MSLIQKIVQFSPTKVKKKFPISIVIFDGRLLEKEITKDREGVRNVTTQ